MEDLRTVLPAAPASTVQFTDRFHNALQFAFDLHQHQRRKASGITASFHPLHIPSISTLL